jgi:hypothetical protein
MVIYTNDAQNANPTTDTNNKRNFVLEEPTFIFSVVTCYPNLFLVKTVHPDKPDKPWDNAANLLFKRLEIKSVDRLAEFLCWSATEPHRAMIYGQLLPGLTGRQRRRIRDGEYPATIECPSRNHLVFDLDDVTVPEGLGLGHKVAEAGYYIRDKLLPPMFYRVRCVVTATASTGRKGPTTARIRFYVPLPHPVPLSSMYLWAKELARKRPELRLDSSVFEPNHIIFTGRPRFEECYDPVPAGCRVTVLEGDVKYFVGPFPAPLPEPIKNVNGCIPIGEIKVCHDLPEWLMEPTANDAGCGVAMKDEPSPKAKKRIKFWFEVLNGCGTGKKTGEFGRHNTLRDTSWEALRLASEGEAIEHEIVGAWRAATQGIPVSKQ